MKGQAHHPTDSAFGIKAFPQRLLSTERNESVPIVTWYLLSVRRVYAPRFFVSSQQGLGVTDNKAPPPLGVPQRSGLQQTML